MGAPLERTAPGITASRADTQRPGTRSAVSGSIDHRVVSDAPNASRASEDEQPRNAETETKRNEETHD